MSRINKANGGTCGALVPALGRVSIHGLVMGAGRTSYLSRAGHPHDSAGGRVLAVRSVEVAQDLRVCAGRAVVA